MLQSEDGSGRLNLHSTEAGKQTVQANRRGFLLLPFIGSSGFSGEILQAFVPQRGWQRTREGIYYICLELIWKGFVCLFINKIPYIYDYPAYPQRAEEQLACTWFAASWSLPTPSSMW